MHLEEHDGPDLLALYFGTEAGEFVDLEVAATAAIEWARGLRAAATAIEPGFEYRVNFIEAEPGSSKWFARIERAREIIEDSAPNVFVKRVVGGWQKVPLILRLAVSLAVVIPTTAKPTYEYWTGTEDFSETQTEQITAAVRKAQHDPEVKTQQRRLYQSVQRDRKIVSLSTGVADKTSWKPQHVIDVREFPLADGLFDLQEMANHERESSVTLDVLLVTPRLLNAQKAWEFRQEGIPGTFKAQMKDKRFLAALEEDGGIKETLRANIPMKIRLHIKQHLVKGEWKVAPKGRSVIEVLSPRVY